MRVEATLASCVRSPTGRSPKVAFTHHGIHAALVDKLEEAEGGDPGALQGCIHLLGAQRGKKVTEAWADRLTANADYVGVNWR